MVSKQEKLSEILQGIETFMLVTKEEESMRARPMAVVGRRNCTELSFFTASSSPKTDEIKQDQNVMVTFQDSSRFVSLQGRAYISLDMDRIHSLWKEQHRLWFPDGPDDSEICLVIFRIESAEYWDVSGLNKITFMYKAIKSYVSGAALQRQDPAEHGRL